MLLIMLQCATLLGQGIEWGFELTLTKGNKIELENPSIGLRPQNSFSISGGVNCMYLTESGFGIRAAINSGYHAQTIKLGQDINKYPLVTYIPIGLKVEPVFRFKAISNQFEFFSGIEGRIYYKNATSSAVFSNEKGNSYEFIFPNETKKSLQPNIFVGISLLYPIGEKHNLSVGVVRNVGLKNFMPGILNVNQGSGDLKTSFASNSTYWGIRMMYSFK